MSFTIPDKGEGANDVQSILFQEYLDVLVAGLSGIDSVEVGCAVTAQATPNMTVAVAAGAVRSNNARFVVTAGNGTITAAHASNPRLDLVVITSAGAIAVRAGTPAVNPKPAARTANDVVLAVVYVPAADTTIEGTQITDLRVFDSRLNGWPVNSVYTSLTNTNPSALLGGGTWVSFGSGRVLVGFDAGQTEFDTAEKTGGAKTHTLTTAEMPAHTHTQSFDTTVGTLASGTVSGTNTGSQTGSTGGGGAHNNLQPYIVVYFWKRTA